MRSVNPLVIPRNHKIENALEKANDSNLEPFNKLGDALPTFPANILYTFFNIIFLTCIHCKH